MVGTVLLGYAESRMLDTSPKRERIDSGVETREERLGGERLVS